VALDSMSLATYTLSFENEAIMPWWYGCYGNDAQSRPVADLIHLGDHISSYSSDPFVDRLAVLLLAGFSLLCLSF